MLNSSQLPFHSLANITQILGDDCTEYFLFLSIRWLMQPSDPLTQSFYTFPDRNINPCIIDNNDNDNKKQAASTNNNFITLQQYL